MTRYEYCMHKFDELPPPIAERAKRSFKLLAASDYWHKRERDMRRSLSEVVGGALMWSATREGGRFWNDVRDAAEHGQQYPTVKGLPE